MPDEQVMAVADGLATIDETASFLRLSRGSIYNLMNRGQLRFAKIGKCRRIPWSEVRRLAASSLTGVSDEQ
jgi:excisionase family DNA binding protein